MATVTLFYKKLPLLDDASLDCECDSLNTGVGVCIVEDALANAGVDRNRGNDTVETEPDETDLPDLAV